MLLNKLHTYLEQVQTYLQKDKKLEKECCDMAITSPAITTGEVFGPDTPQSSLANTYKTAPQVQKGQAGIDTTDIKAAMVPAIPYKKVRKKSFHSKKN